MARQARKEAAAPPFLTPELAALEWDRVGFGPFAEAGARVLARMAQGAAQPEALDAEPGAPVRFVAHDMLPAGMPYERYIFESGNCPVRPGLHDFFNGLCWLRMPQSKKQLNAMQASAIGAATVGAARGPLRDAITVFDENGALLDAPAPLWEALLARDWRRMFIDLRPLWQEARLLVFGHALLEKLVQPRKAITAHVWRGPAALADLARADAWLAGELTPERLVAKPFTPLPLLGIPGWWSGNENFSFYDDSLVFRPAGVQRLRPGH